MKELNTKITDVVVFSSKAKLTRKGNVSIEAGNETISVTGLPQKLDPDSLRVKASGSAEFTISGVDLRKAFFKDIPEGIVRELTDKIEKLIEKKNKSVDQKGMLESKQKHIEGLLKSTRIFASGFAKGELSIEKHQQLLDSLMKESDGLCSDLRKKEKEINEIGKEIKKLQEEVDLAGNLRPRERYTADISVSSEKNCKLNIELSYHISGASWKPEYDIRLGKENLHIDYLAAVRQRTGEEWENVSLRLSTLSPSDITKVPELEPWFISPAKKAPRGLYETRDSNAFAASAIRLPDEKMSYSDVIREEFPEAMEAEYEEAEILRSETTVSYGIKNPVSVPGDGSYHKVHISGFNLDKRMKHITAPLMDERVFRITDTTNGELFLLPGKGQIFDEEEYIGPVTIEHIAPGEKFELFSGSDDRIKVRRELKSRDTDKKLLSDRKKINYTFEISLENFTSAEKEINVKDQIPVSTHENIKVSLLNSSPGTETADELNRFEWNVKVAPGSKETIRYTYSIEFPREMVIPGLP